MDLSLNIHPVLAITLFVCYATLRIVLAESRGIGVKRRKPRI